MYSGMYSWDVLRNLPHFKYDPIRLNSRYKKSCPGTFGIPLLNGCFWDVGQCVAALYDGCFIFTIGQQRNMKACYISSKILKLNHWRYFYLNIAWIFSSECAVVYENIST